MRNRKETAWKKNRKFGVVKGGRSKPKWNSVMRILHELTKPTADQELPILLQDRPPSQHFWPVSVEELREALDRLPPADTKGLTHLWLRTPSSKMKRQGLRQSDLVTGRGVCVIMIAPWPIDRTIHFGRSRPSEATRRLYESFGATPYKKARAWYATFSPQELRRYYLESLLYCEVGDYVQRRKIGLSGTRKNSRRLTSFAYDYSRRFQALDYPRRVQPEEQPASVSPAGE